MSKKAWWLRPRISGVQQPNGFWIRVRKGTPDSQQFLVYSDDVFPTPRVGEYFSLMYIARVKDMVAVKERV